jgi:hypothetical protein
MEVTIPWPFAFSLMTNTMHLVVLEMWPSRLPTAL